MASDRPEQNDAEQDEKNTDENDLQEIEDLKIQGKTFLIDNKLGVFPSVLHTHFRCTMHIDQNKTISIKTQLIIHIPIISSHPELSVLISPARHYLCQGHTLRTLSILKVFLYQDVSPELMIKHPLQVRNHKKTVSRMDITLRRMPGPCGSSKMTRPNSGKRTRGRSSHSTR